MQTLAFPLVIEFGWTKEIEDRLLAPMLDRPRGGREGPVRGDAGADRDRGDDPDRDPRARLDPVALGRPTALPRRRRCSGRCSAPRSASCSGRSCSRTGSTSSSRSSSRRSSSRAAASTRGRRSPVCAGSRCVTAANPMTYVSEGLRGRSDPERSRTSEPWICLSSARWVAGRSARDRHPRLLPARHRLASRRPTTVVDRNPPSASSGHHRSHGFAAWTNLSSSAGGWPRYPARGALGS